jgi:hypothetical protein
MTTEADAHFGGYAMRLKTRMMVAAGILAAGGLLASAGLAHAGCGGGGGSWGTRTCGRPAAYSGGGCCGSGCGMMNMGGMSMGGMAMPAPAMNIGTTTQAPAAPTAAPAATAGHYYTCPMHPSVVSATPGACPYCHMALSYR